MKRNLSLGKEGLEVGIGGAATKPMMKVAILAGGLGTRLREETEFRPKPMVEIGGRPILWHIMKGYARFGFTDFIICLGYKGDVIRDYFLNYRYRNSDLTVTLGSHSVMLHSDPEECGWTVTLAETGEKTMTGGRLKRIAKYIDHGMFMATYGDGVANVSIPALLDCHLKSGKLATVTAVRPSSRFGELSVVEGLVSSFEEKPQVQNSWVNGGFFVFHREVLELIPNDEARLETDVLQRLAGMRQLAVYQHDGFWQCMDNLREMELLNKMWQSGDVPWLAEDCAPVSGPDGAAARGAAAGGVLRTELH
jgi:glucose-1-phosphate cytidylyltransferase